VLLHNVALFVNSFVLHCDFAYLSLFEDIHSVSGWAGFFGFGSWTIVQLAKSYPYS
jgi:hypothetical protein